MVRKRRNNEVMQPFGDEDWWNVALKQSLNKDNYTFALYTNGLPKCPNCKEQISSPVSIYRDLLMFGVVFKNGEMITNRSFAIPMEMCCDFEKEGSWRGHFYLTNTSDCFGDEYKEDHEECSNCGVRNLCEHYTEFLKSQD